MKNNKMFQCIVGCFVIYLAWQLHSAGWFAAAADALSGNSFSRDGFGSSVLNLLWSALPLVVDALCTVGIIAIAFVTFLWRVIKPFTLKLAVLLDKKLEGYGIDLYELDLKTTPAPRKLDLAALENVLGGILDRVQNIETKIWK